MRTKWPQFAALSRSQRNSAYERAKRAANIAKGLRGDGQPRQRGKRKTHREYGAAIRQRNYLKGLNSRGEVRVRNTRYRPTEERYRQFRESLNIGSVSNDLETAEIAEPRQVAEML